MEHGDKAAIRCRLPQRETLTEGTRGGSPAWRKGSDYLVKRGRASSLERMRVARKIGRVPWSGWPGVRLDPEVNEHGRVIGGLL